MASEDFIIRIILDAQSKVAPVMEAVAREVDKVDTRFKSLNTTAGSLNKRMQQLENHVSKARDTFRSINPTLESFDRKMKSVNETTIKINRNFGVLERNSAKAAGALGALGNIVDRLERKLNQLDVKMTEMGARKYKPELDVQTSKSEAKIDALIAKLASATRQRHTFHTDAETAAAERKIESLRRQLHALGAGDRADRLIIDIEADFDAQQARAEAARLFGELRAASREKFTIETLLKKGQFDRNMIDLKRQLFEVAGIRVHPEVRLGMKEFEAQRLIVEEELVRLGMKREHVKVVLDLDREHSLKEIFSSDSPLNKQLSDALSKAGQQISDSTEVTFRGLINGAINLAIILSEPLLSAITGVVGGLVAIGVAAGQAIAGLVGLASAIVAQVLPVFGVLALVATRVAAVIKVVQLAQTQRDKGTQQGAATDKSAANALNALRSAHEGVANAQRNLAEAQKRLNEARRQGVRTLTDLALAERRASLDAQQSKIALATQVASGGTGSLIGSTQLQAESDSIAANRAQVDNRRAQSGGINGLPAVQSAIKGVADARRALEQARRAVDAASRNSDYASGKVGAAADNYLTALAKLSKGERVLLRSIERIKAVFTDTNGVVRGISDNVIIALARALDTFRRLIEDSDVQTAFLRLSRTIAGSIGQLAKLFTTGPMRQALIFFTNEAARNMTPVTKILGDLVRIFVAIGRAASGPLRVALDAVAKFLDRITANVESDSGQSKLAKFFYDALDPLEAFGNLIGSIFNLFTALAGPGGATDEGTRGINGLANAINRSAAYVRKNGDEVRKFFRDSINVLGVVAKVFFDLAAAMVKSFDPKSAAALGKFLSNVLIPIIFQFITVLGKFVRPLLDLANSPVGGFLIKMAGWMLAIGFVLARVLGPMMTFAGFLLRLPSYIRTVMRFIGLFGGVLGRLPGLFLLVGRGFMALMAAMGPVGWIALIVSALVTLYLTWGDFRKVVNSVLRWIKDHWKTILSIVMGPLGLIIAGISKWGDKLFGPFKGAFDKLKGIAGKAFGAIKDAAGALWSGLKNIFSSDNVDELKKPFNERAVDKFNKTLADKYGNKNNNKKDKKPKIEDFLSASEAKLTPEESKQINKLWDDILAHTKKRTEDITAAVREMRQGIEKSIDRLRRVSSDDFDTLWRRGRHSMGNLTESITHQLGKIADVFRTTMDNVSRTVYKGFKYIRDQTNVALKSFGEDPIDINLAPPGGDRRHASGGRVGVVHAATGWIGNQGERGKDTVHAVLGRGEAVLNWAHQKVVDPALRTVYGFGLDEMFKRTNALHAGTVGQMPGGYASGGGPDFGPHPSNVNAGLRRLLGRIQDRFPGMVVTSTTDHSYLTSSRNVSDHTTGNAMDISAGVPLMNRVARWLLSSGVARRAKQLIYSGNPTLAWNRGKDVGPGFFGPAVMAQHANHIHIALVGALGSLIDAEIKKLTVNGPAGALKSLAQAAIDKLRKVANDKLDSSGSGGSGDARLDPNARVRGRVSVFGPPIEPASNTASGLSSAEPGIALNINAGTDSGWNNSTTDAWVRARKLFKVVIQGHKALLRVIDKGPSGATNRAIDVTGAGARKMGLNPRNFPTDAIGTATPAAFGGFMANGGSFLVNRPTAFVAGDNGPEMAHFVPLAGGSNPKKRPLPNPLRAYTRGLEDISADFAPVDQLTGLLIKVYRSISRLAKRGDKSLGRMANVLDTLTTDESSPFKLMDDAMDKLATRAARVTRNLIYRVSPTGRPQRNQVSAAVLGKRDLDALADTRSGLVTEQRFNTRLLNRAQSGLSDVSDRLSDARKALKNADTDKEKDAAKKLIKKYTAEQTKFKGVINRLLNQRAEIADRLSQNAQEIVERNEQMQQDMVNEINSKFERINAGIERARRRNTAFGTGSEVDLINQTEAAARQQVEELTQMLGYARQNGNSELAKQLEDQIAELNTTIDEIPTRRIQAQIDEITKQAEKNLSAADTRQSLAQLGVTSDMIANGSILGPGLGRTNFSAVDSALRDKDAILRDERAQLASQLAQAGAIGDQAHVESLTKQMGDLDKSIAENSKAIQDNTQAAFMDALARRQTTSDFFLGTNQIQTAILEALGIDSSGSVAERGSLLSGRISDDKGSLLTLLNSVAPGLVDSGALMAISGAGTVPFFDSVYQKVIDSGLFTDDQMESIRNLINGIETNTQALIENSKAISGLTTQSFSSTAWQRFRIPIFDGAGALLPQYASQIPSFDGGGVMSGDGLAMLHDKEVILTRKQAAALGGGGAKVEETHLHITSPVERFDPVWASRQLAFARRNK